MPLCNLKVGLSYSLKFPDDNSVLYFTRSYEWWIQSHGPSNSSQVICWWFWNLPFNSYGCELHYSLFFISLNPPDDNDDTGSTIYFTKCFNIDIMYMTLEFRSSSILKVLTVTFQELCTLSYLNVGISLVWTFLMTMLIVQCPLPYLLNMDIVYMTLKYLDGFDIYLSRVKPLSYLKVWFSLVFLW